MKPIEILDRDNNTIAEWDGERWTGSCADYAREMSLDNPPLRVAALLVETAGDTDIEPNLAAVDYIVVLLEASQRLDSITIGTTVRRPL
ncbi:MAG: hypothetical protein KDB26_14935 [Microthrixaceae bacterium]|nr:hypothetical protein [Microthrixaceae bacterium]